MAAYPMRPIPRLGTAAAPGWSCAVNAGVSFRTVNRAKGGWIRLFGITISIVFDHEVEVFVAAAG